MSSMTYEEVSANVTWYLLNSYFDDPTLIYMENLQTEMAKKMKPPETNFTQFDPSFSVYVDTSPILRYGNYPCSAPGKEAYTDSPFSCLLFQLPFFLEKLQFGHFGFAFVLPVILISIFGGIKESFRWFILNQAIWDLFVCYDFICSKPTILGWFGKSYKTSTTCFYYTENSKNNLLILSMGQSFRSFLKNAPFISIFLIAFSRFLAMYFSKFYRSFTKSNYKMIAFLIIFNLFFILIFGFHRIWINFFFRSDFKGFDDCATQFCLPPYNRSNCNYYVPEYFRCVNRVVFAANAQIDFVNSPWVMNIPNIFAPIMLLFANICVVFLFYKIASQLKFQLKTNRESFIQTMKISVVVGYQCFITSIIFVITCIQKYLETMCQTSTGGTIYYSIPSWLFFLQYNAMTTSLNLIRVFLDSFVVLVALNAYSSRLVKIFKFFVLCFTNFRLALTSAKNMFSSNSTQVTVLNATAKK